MLELVVASHNAHKIEEIQAVLSDICILKSADQAGVCGEIPEDFDTLEQNSRQKAEYVHRATGLDCFADDTGLEVEALDGRPGAFSARYAGPGCSFEDNISRLLEELEGKGNRAARFRTVITLFLGGNRYTFEGEVRGDILLARQGKEGFGYDPVFRPEGYEESFAQMPLSLKNTLSHRGRAIQAMRTFLLQQP